MRESVAAPTNQRFRPHERVKARADFLRLQDQRRRVYTPHFLVLFGPSPRGASRVGITVTRKIANAVGRNRVKRLVREVFRRNKALFPLGTDIVFIARKGSEALDYATLLAEVSHASGAMLRKAARAERPSEAS